MPNPASTGVLKRKIIVVPWTVKSSLYSCALSRSLFGDASCHRMTSAIKPATKKKMKLV